MRPAVAHLERRSVVRLVVGAAAGTVATAPMTALMELAFRRLPQIERYPLPPREILEELAERVDAPLPEREAPRVWLTLVAHFGYGAATGAVLGFDSARSCAQGVMRGALYGCAVWVLSYLGWLPALRVLRPATQHPARRNALMIAAHLVWGGTAGCLAHWMRARLLAAEDHDRAEA